MWGRRRERVNQTVTCIACGSSVPRDNAREYDKYGDRWDRKGKRFEFLCKPCDRGLCHQPRDDLEDLLLGIEARATSSDEFLADYCRSVEERYGPIEEPER